MNKIRVVVLIILVVSLGMLIACAAPISPSHLPNRPATPVYEPSSEQELVSSLPINIIIHYIGVRNAHGGNVQLVVVAGDENGGEKCFIPPVAEGFPMLNCQTMRIEQRVFHTPSAEGKVKINILAYHRDQSRTDYLNMINMMEWYYGDSINMIKQLIENMPQNDKLIGYYEESWGPDESWGIGQHYEVGHGDDFRVWFSVWSDEEPSPIDKPSLSPNIEIKNVDIPSKVKQSNPGWFYIIKYTNTLTLMNHESFPVNIYWNARTSAEKEFSDTVTIPAGSTIDISGSYHYVNDIGPLKWTYTISHDGKELDSWVGLMEVIPGPYS